jgi:hypothetical protein
MEARKGSGVINELTAPTTPLAFLPGSRRTTTEYVRTRASNYSTYI